MTYMVNGRSKLVDAPAFMSKIKRRLIFSMSAANDIASLNKLAIKKVLSVRNVYEICSAYVAE